MKKIIVLFLAAVISTHAMAALSELDRADVGSNQKLLNGGFESGKYGWTISGGNSTITTTGSQVSSGRQALSWDSTAASQQIVSATVLNNTVKGLLGNDPMGCCMFKCASGTCTHMITLDGVIYQTITSSTSQFVKSCVRSFAISTPVSLIVESVASNEPTLYIDDCRVEPYLGRTYNSLTGGVLEGETTNIATGFASRLQPASAAAASTILNVEPGG